MPEIKFMCCFCGGNVESTDDEAAQVVLIFPWGDNKESEEQYWFCHRKPCFESALIERVRIFEDDEMFK